MAWHVSGFLGLFVLLHGTAGAALPNIVWFLTDDQDQMLGASFPERNGGVGPMPKTKRTLQQQGATAERFYIHTPICNPSRNELLSGRYFHNIKGVGGDIPKGAMHVNESYVNQHTFVRDLREQANYHTGMFGKYMNVMPPAVPPGFDAWMANPGGDYVAPKFQMYNVEGIVPGMVRDGDNLQCWASGAGAHAGDPKYGCFTGTIDPSNYSTSIIGNVSMAWIRKVHAEDASRPFFAYIAPKAAHEPFNPAPWCESHWDESWPATEPRDNPAWNSSADARRFHHGNIATEPLLTETAAQVVTGVFKNRWRTLMSVDDLIADVVELCEALGVADNTYFFYSSDHGFQLGQFNILMDKRNVYEWDQKIHLLARGPGIAKGSTWSEPATQVDMAPTFLSLAGVEVAPDRFDGKSLVPLLVDAETARAVASVDADAYRAAWRDHVFFEYYFVDNNDKCVTGCDTLSHAQEYPLKDSDCVDLTPFKNAHCWGGNLCNTSCYATETTANNYIAVRFMPGSAHGDVTYAEFKKGDQMDGNIDFSNVDFVEFFDNQKDTWQMNNLAPRGDPIFFKTNAEGRALHATVHQWYGCKGATCL